ncbi:MAG: superoxide dismutase [Coprothermobacterota bacterium]|nr:superoxide dismutase [Coprothermobacterota bacterium]
MAYQVKDYSHLIGMEGFSETLLKNHFMLYSGYVANTNKVMDGLTTLAKEGRAATPEFAEMKRRLGWEFNGMRLHEYYFENLGGDGKQDPSSKLAITLAKQWGSLEMWEADFRATAMMRGIGWTVLYLDSITSQMLNVWINEHDVGHPAGCKPLLVLDVFEHAFLTDYGLKRPDYIEVFFRHINWTEVGKRLS